jgi:hypothetical protein
MLAAAIWMLHPLNVATVAWVSEQKNTLAAVFALTSCIAYTKTMLVDRSTDEDCHPERSEGSREPSRHPISRSSASLRMTFSAYTLALFHFALSLLAKPSFVALPLILLIMIWWRFGRVSRRQIAQLIPMFIVAIASAVVAIWFQARHVEQIGNDAGPIITRIARAGWAVWFYLGKMIAPVHLSPIYPRWAVDPTRPLHWAPLAALIVVVVGIALARRRGLIALVLIGLLLLAPIVGLANSSFFRLSYVADHWTYPALMVFALAVAWVIERIAFGTSRSGTEVPPPARQWHLSATVLVIALALASLTWRRSRAYHDTLSLWQDAASKVQNNYAIYNNLAWACLDAGRAHEALTAAERAAQLAPDEPEVRQTLTAARLRVASQQSEH